MVQGAESKRGVVSGLVAATDVFLLLATGFALHVARFGWDPELGGVHVYNVSALLVGTLLILQGFQFYKLYGFESLTEPVLQFKRIVLIILFVFLLLILVVFGLKISSSFSRVWVFSWFLTAPLAIFIGRVLWYVYLRRGAFSGHLKRKVAVFGWTEQAEKLLERFEQIHDPWTEIIGVFEDRQYGRTRSSARRYRHLGSLDDLRRYARRHAVDEVIITIPWSAADRVFSVYSKLKELPVNIRLGSDMAGFVLPRLEYTYFAGVPLLGVALRPLAGWRLVAKELEDKVLAMLFLLLLAPVMILIALAILIDSGRPILFKQVRYGFNNREFNVFKFRTMTATDSNPEKLDQAHRDDARVTRVGRWLRHFSLDELPQLFNVLQGTMSLVGPRPHPVPLNDAFQARIDGYYGRHRVKPGMTGWAQINGYRGETATPDRMEKRVEHDLYYIENWSVWFDFRILLFTVQAVVSPQNAY